MYFFKIQFHFTEQLVEIKYIKKSTRTSGTIVYNYILSWDTHPGPHKIYTLKIHEDLETFLLLKITIICIHQLKNILNKL